MGSTSRSFVSLITGANTAARPADRHSSRFLTLCQGRINQRHILKPLDRELILRRPRYGARALGIDRCEANFL